MRCAVYGAVIVLFIEVFQNLIPVSADDVCGRWFHKHTVRNKEEAKINCNAKCHHLYGHPTNWYPDKLPNDPPFANGKCVLKKCVCYISKRYWPYMRKREKLRLCFVPRLCKKMVDKIQRRHNVNNWRAAKL